MSYRISNIISMAITGLGFAQACEGRYIHYDAIRYQECAQAIQNHESFQSSSFFNEPLQGEIIPEGASSLEILQIKNAYALIEHERLHEQLWDMLKVDSVSTGAEELQLMIHFLKLGIGIHFQDGSLLTIHISLEHEDGVILYRDGERL